VVVSLLLIVLHARLAIIVPSLDFLNRVVNVKLATIVVVTQLFLLLWMALLVILVMLVTFVHKAQIDLFHALLVHLVVNHWHLSVIAVLLGISALMDWNLKSVYLDTIVQLGLDLICFLVLQEHTATSMGYLDLISVLSVPQGFIALNLQLLMKPEFVKQVSSVLLVPIHRHLTE
jgi:hypothetical protein